MCEENGYGFVQVSLGICVCQDEFEHVWLTDWREVVKQHTSGWEEYAACECIVRWAYVSDITPKGGKK